MVRVDKNVELSKIIYEIGHIDNRRKYRPLVILPNKVCALVMLPATSDLYTSFNLQRAEHGGEA